MRKSIALAWFAAAAAGGLAGEDLQGVLADSSCAARMVHDGRERVLQQDKNCSLVRNPNRRSYALITDDNRVFQLDDTGNGLAKELLKNSHDRDNLHVVARGQRNGEQIKVETMSIL